MTLPASAMMETFIPREDKVGAAKARTYYTRLARARIALRQAELSRLEE